MEEIYLFTEQPTTCPVCGNRTEILLDFYFIAFEVQYHRCLSFFCRFEFIVEEDN
jgi:hypothetical protein